MSPNHSVFHFGMDRGSSNKILSPPPNAPFSSKKYESDRNQANAALDDRIVSLQHDNLLVIEAPDDNKSISNLLLLRSNNQNQRIDLNDAGRDQKFSRGDSR